MAVTLESIRGKIVDVDSHEGVPIPRWKDVFGDRAKRFVDANKRVLGHSEEIFGDLATGDYEDNLPITAQSVWEEKFNGAPSAGDIDRRPAVLDEMGIHRALVFPGFGLLAFGVATGYASTSEQAAKEEIDSAWPAIDAYNEWAGTITNRYPERLRVVGLLPTNKPGLTIDALITETKRLMKMGVRGLFISSGAPPAGVSPGDRALDPWYALLAEANISICFHSGGEAGYRVSEVWGHLPQFRTHYRKQFDLSTSPLFTSGVHVPVENFISTMLLAGVFERHPALRIGAIELFSHWIGPLAERLDFLYDKTDWDGAKDLKLKPSEYLNRHVRVSAFLCEPIEKYVERYPYLEDVYCYASDFPHPEGSKWSLRKFYDRLAPTASDRFMKKFFTTNGQLILA